MGKSSPSAPTPPNANQTAAAQAAANKDAVRESALVSQINQVTPYGSLTYTGQVGQPGRTATQTLAPAQQQMLDLTNQAGIGFGQLANQQLGAVGDRLGAPLDLSALGAVPQAGEQGWQRAYDSTIQRNAPQAQEQLRALETRLANQGIGYGSQAYNAAMDDYNRGQNDFRLAAQGQATGQQAQQYGMESNAYNQALQSMLTERQTPLNELAAMLSGSQVQSPQFAQTGQYGVQPADIMGATYGNYNGQMNAYNANLQNQSASQQGLYGLLGSGAMAGAYMWSDRRLKRDIHRIGTLRFPLYVWRYLWGTVGIGFMADELPDHLVRRMPNGFLAVNYAEALR